MERFNFRLIFGILLILAGAIFLAQTMGFFTIGGSLWGILFGLGGLAFLSVLVTDRKQWWAAIPGIVLLSLAALIILSEAFPGYDDRLGGGVFLGGIGLAFLVVYLVAPANWWAIIPAGVMMTLGVVAGLDNIPGLETGGIFFLGLGATFGVLSLLKVDGRRMGWPLIPAGVLLLMGLLIMASASNLASFMWPVAIIVVGIFLLMRSFMRRA